MTGLPSTCTVNSRGVLSLGSVPRGNSTSTTGPAIPTTRPSVNSVSVATGESLVIVMTCALSLSNRAECRGSVGGTVVEDFEVDDVVFVAAGQCFGTADDLHDFGGDRVLASAVPDAAEVLDQFLGVVGRALHRSLSKRVLAGRGVEQRCVDTCFDVLRQQRVEDGGGVRLVLE